MRPEQIIDGLLQALEILERKSKAIEKPKKLLGEITEKEGVTDKTKMAGRV